MRCSAGHDVTARWVAGKGSFKGYDLKLCREHQLILAMRPHRSPVAWRARRDPECLYCGQPIYRDSDNRWRHMDERGSIWCHWPPIDENETQATPKEKP